MGVSARIMSWNGECGHGRSSAKGGKRKNRNRGEVNKERIGRSGQ
jgi:hypothetical protein